MGICHDGDLDSRDYDHDAFVEDNKLREEEITYGLFSTMKKAESKAKEIFSKKVSETFGTEIEPNETQGSRTAFGKEWKLSGSKTEANGAPLKYTSTVWVYVVSIKVQ